MFFSHRIYTVILIYVLAILLISGLGIILIVTHTGTIIGCLLILCSLFIIEALVTRLNRFNLKLRFFFDAVEDKENMISFNEHTTDITMNALSRSLNRVNELLARAKAESGRKERFYSSLLEEVPDGVVAWNTEGKIILANSAALQLLEFEQLGCLRQLEQQYPEIKDFLLHAKTQTSTLLKSVSKHQLSLSVNYMKLESETITLLAIKDISNELSEKESESWNKLTHVLTHEIMNTIAPIVSLSQTLSTYPETDEKIARGLHVIREQGERLMEFTESYRHLSYLPQPTTKPFSLTDSLRNLSVLLQSDFETAHIHFTLQSDPTDITITGDQKQLIQVFLNLIKNSMQALEGLENGNIEVNLKQTDKLYIHITDNGKGIAPELQDKIFVPFFTTKTEGMGVGLSLCREILKRHEGNFYLQESRKGKTVFVIEWPVAH